MLVFAHNIYSFVLVLPLLLTACSTNIRPGVGSNPPPKAALSAASAIELLPLTVSDEIREREPNVVKKLTEKINLQCGSMIKAWNFNPAKNGDIFTIVPNIDKLKFISTGERILGVAFVGGSAIQTSFEIKNSKTGEIIANPIFYQHANAWGSAYSYGSTDRLMLDRIVNNMAAYLVNNYENAVGGLTGDNP